jgi:hypothetical protein
VSGFERGGPGTFRPVALVAGSRYPAIHRP